MRLGVAAAAAVMRNLQLRRVVFAYAAFIASEYAAWICVLIYAYREGGSTLAGAIALVQLVPAALAAPVIASLADRRSPVGLLVGGYLLQAISLTVTAIAVAAGLPFLVWISAVVAATAVVTTRPAQTALIPSLVHHAEELSAVNAITGWIESIGIVAAGAITGVVVGLYGVAWGVAAAATLAGVAACLALAARGVSRIAAAGEAAPLLTELTAGIRAIRTNRPARLLIALLTAAWAVVGALDILLVVLAIRVLDRGAGWVGYLNTAYGGGGLVAGAAVAGLVGRRRLSVPIVGGVLLLSLALGAIAFVSDPGPAVVLLAFAGAGRVVFDVATRTLLQRIVPSDVLGRVFGLVEGLAMAGLALGSVAAPALVAFFGSAGAFVGAALILPLVCLVGARALLALDGAAHVPVVEIALLRSLPMFKWLPAPAIEGLAAALVPVPLADGAVLIREGDVGDRFYAIAAGNVDVVSGGVLVATLGRGQGVGEMALLRGIPRTATVTARGEGLVFAIERDPFLVSVIGHAATAAAADGVVDRRFEELSERGLLDESAAPAD